MSERIAQRKVCVLDLAVALGIWLAFVLAAWNAALVGHLGEQGWLAFPVVLSILAIGLPALHRRRRGIEAGSTLRPGLGIGGDLMVFVVAMVLSVTTASLGIRFAHPSTLPGELRTALSGLEHLRHECATMLPLPGGGSGIPKRGAIGFAVTGGLAALTVDLLYRRYLQGSFTHEA